MRLRFTPRSNSGAKPPLRTRQSSRLRRFLRDGARGYVRDEDGSMVIFGVYVLLIMLVFGGIGIDLMHYERDCTSLQNTLDRAVLAAADLDQTLDPATVVRDYLGKAGKADTLTDIRVDEGLSYRVVSADATCAMDTQFMRVSGVDTLSAELTSTAEERIDGVEISLVLDVSGSMNSNSRLSNLKLAAKDFVDEMVDNTEDGNLSISIVPYAMQVALPAKFLDKMNVTQEHDVSNCVNFDNADFYTTAIDPDDLLERTMHFDPWYDNEHNSGYDGREYSPERFVKEPVCEAAEDRPDRDTVVLEKNRTTLKTFIGNLDANGNTSIDVGMKWGVALLDPSLQPVISSLVNDGEISADFADRPTAYTDNETLKVIVLMTDGQNTTQSYLRDEQRAGTSDVWWNEEEKVYSVYAGDDDYDRDGDGDRNEDSFYWVDMDEWHDHPYGNGTYEATTQEKVCTRTNKHGKCQRYEWVYSTETVEEDGEAVELSKGMLQAKTTGKAIANDILAPVIGENAARNLYDANDSIQYVYSGTKNTRTAAICDAAKANDIIIFTIGFEAPSAGLSVLRDCASSESHFFDVDGLEISDAFSSIASSIRKLRLTQ